jgi:CheY-like chemotaxis protein
MEHRVLSRMLEDVPNQEPILAFDQHGERRKTPRPPAKKNKQHGTEGTVRVLLFSGMWEVALYRAEALRGHGLDVTTPRSKEEAIAAIRNGNADVVVLAYTLPNETVRELSDLIRQECPACSLIAISDSGKFDERVAPDAVVTASHGPAALIDAIRKVSRVN